MMLNINCLKKRRSNMIIERLYSLVSLFSQYQKININLKKPAAITPRSRALTV